MKAVRVVVNVKGRSIFGSAFRGSLVDIFRFINRVVIIRVWKFELKYLVSFGSCVFLFLFFLMYI